MTVNFKKLHPYAVIPTKAHDDDAGFDLTAVSFTCDCYGNYVYDTGIAVEIPRGYVGLLFPRSSSSKTDLVMANCVGVIDSNYRGCISAKFKSTIRVAIISTMVKLFLNRKFPKLFPYPAKIGVNNTAHRYEVGERVAQLIIMPYPEVEFVEVDELSDTERGTGSYGSTGR